MSTPPKAKPRLGRGLSSLISVSDLPLEAEINAAPLVAPPFYDPTTALASNTASPLSPSSPAEIPLDRISPNPHQPRKQFDEAGIQSLALSVKTTGLVQPIVVRQIASTDGQVTYQLIAGERRLRAAKAAGLATIPALLREVDPFVQAQMALIENIQREDLNPIDRAQAYRALIDQLGLTQAELASRLGEDRSAVANHLRLLDLSEPVRNLIRNGQLSLGHAKILAGLSDPQRQAELSDMVVTQGLSVRNLERLLEAPPVTPAKPDPKEPSPHIRDLEKTITSTLGMKVQLRSAAQKGKGKLVIHYTNLDQFDQLLEKLGIKPE